MNWPSWGGGAIACIMVEEIINLSISWMIGACTHGLLCSYCVQIWSLSFMLSDLYSRIWSVLRKMCQCELIKYLLCPLWSQTHRIVLDVPGSLSTEANKCCTQHFVSQHPITTQHSYCFSTVIIKTYVWRFAHEQHMKSHSHLMVLWQNFLGPHAGGKSREWPARGWRVGT